MLEDQHSETGGPDHQNRTEIAGPRQADTENSGTDHREAVPVTHQIAGKEDREADLGDLAGLEGEAGNRNPQRCAVDGATDSRQERHQQQQDAGRHENVAEALQHPMIVQQQHDQQRQRHRDCGPHQLSDAERFPALVASAEIDAVDHRHPQSVEHGGDRQDQRVGVGGTEAQRQMQSQSQNTRHDGELQQAEIDLDADPQLDQQHGGGVDQQRQQQQRQLQVSESAGHADESKLRLRSLDLSRGHR